MSLEMSFSELTAGRKVPEQGQIAGRVFRTSAPFFTVQDTDLEVTWYVWICGIHQRW